MIEFCNFFWFYQIISIKNSRIFIKILFLPVFFKIIICFRLHFQCLLQNSHYEMLIPLNILNISEFQDCNAWLGSVFSLFFRFCFSYFCVKFGLRLSIISPSDIGNLRLPYFSKNVHCFYNLHSWIS